jgi:hypothetical protein
LSAPSIYWLRIARMVFAGLSLLLPGGAIVCLAQAQTVLATVAAGIDFAPPPIDPAFERGLVEVKRISGLRETNPGVVLPAWTPGLCMLIGFRTDVASKQFVHLVEVTTLDPLATDARGRTNVLPPIMHFMKFTGTNHLQPKPRTHVFKTLGRPVRVRLYDAEGRFLKECRDFLPWEFLTNGLVDVCSAVREAGRMTATNGISARRGMTNGFTSDWLNAVEIRVARGGLALNGLFAVIGDTDALDDVRAHATAVVRPPNFLKALFEMKLDLQLDPKFDRATDLPASVESSSARRVRFPLSLRQGQRILTTVDFIVGSTEGAWFLTSGVRALRATHPTKSDRRMLAQVLAVGTVSALAASAPPGDAR